MPWQVRLCVYRTSAICDFGHAFVAVVYDGEVHCAAGLSPRELPGGVKDELRTIWQQPGQIFSELDSLGNANLKSKTWDISEPGAIALMNKINESRRINIERDDSGMPADQLVELEDRAGGPDYALLSSNCAIYALELLQVAGVQVQHSALVTRPDSLLNKIIN